MKSSTLIDATKHLFLHIPRDSLWESDVYSKHFTKQAITQPQILLQRKNQIPHLKLANHFPVWCTNSAVSQVLT